MLATLLIIIICANVSSAQTATSNQSSLQASSAAPSNEKKLTIAYQKNTNSTWGYKAIEDNQTIYILENNPGSSSGYSIIEESTTAGQRILKAMQLQKNLLGHLLK